MRRDSIAQSPSVDKTEYAHSSPDVNGQDIGWNSHLISKWLAVVRIAGVEIV
jgi:hypothetical protein